MSFAGPEITRQLDCNLLSLEEVVEMLAEDDDDAAVEVVTVELAVVVGVLSSAPGHDRGQNP